MTTPSQEEIEQGARWMCDFLRDGEPSFWGRNGTIELETLLIGADRRRDPTIPYPESVRRRIELHAGVFPATPESLDRWSMEYMSAFQYLDGMAAGWYSPLAKEERSLIDSSRASPLRFPLRSLEPYYVPPEIRWTQHLAGKHVAVVSSFTKTIQEQLVKNRQKLLWGSETDSLLPNDVKWSFFQTGYAPVLAEGRCEWPAGIDTWEKAVTMVEADVIASGAKVVLIGCGGLGMILGARLRRAGLTVVVLGGALQVLFGVRGMRWKSHSIISKFWNSNWAWPKIEETPKGAIRIEGGCYWDAR